MTDGDFQFLAHMLKQRSGLVLTPDKSYLVESRLGPLARREGLGSVPELINIVRARRDERLTVAIVDAMTTNETFFFRDKVPFDLLKDTVLPRLAQSRPAGTRLRIWSAACSTGQEAYSIAMTIDQNPACTRGQLVEIIGTDISERVVEKARSGVFSQFEVQRGLPVTSLVKYFEKVDDNWRISTKVKALCRFQLGNLLEDNLALGRFDIIFLRNVLIYFETDAKKAILERMARNAPDDAVLFLGAAETVLGVTEAWSPSPSERGLYIRNPAFKRAAA